MNMKKALIYIALASLSLTACNSNKSKVDTTDSEASQEYISDTKALDEEATQEDTSEGSEEEVAAQ